MRRRLLVAFLVLLLALAGGRELLDDDTASPGGGGAVAPSSVLHGTVTRIVDGDTIRVRLDSGVTERVRYTGIDTPESVAPDTPVQCFGPAASAFNARLVDGRHVRLELDAEARDRFGRLLAYVRRDDDGLFVNAELVRLGYAEPLRLRPNVRHAAAFEALAREARAADRGLWRACAKG